MKSIRRSLLAYTSIVLALSACSAGDPSASPVPDDKPVINSENSSDKSTTDSESSANDDADPNENTTVRNLDDTYDPDAISCEDPGVECDDYGNVLNADEIEEDTTAEEDESIRFTDDEIEQLENATTEEGACKSTLPGGTEEGTYYSSFNFIVLDESFMYDWGAPYEFTIEMLDGTVLFTCEDNSGKAYGWGLPSAEYPPLRIYGEVDGKKFDVVFSMNDHYTGMNGEKIYHQVSVLMETDGSITVYMGSPNNPDYRWELENAA